MFVDLADSLEDGIDKDWCQAQRWLVEQEKSGSGHKGAGDCQHLLFATGKCAPVLFAALAQNRKKPEYPLKVLFDPVFVLS